MRLSYHLFLGICIILTGCTHKFNSDAVFEKYTIKELDYFSDVGFFSRKWVHRWDQEIKISVKGIPKDGDLQFLDTIINELKPLIAPLTIRKVENEGNVEVFFIEKDDIGPYGDCKPFIKFPTNNFKKAKIRIIPTINGKYRQKVLRHEFCHALGIEHPSVKTGIRVGEPFKEDLLFSTIISPYSYFAGDDPNEIHLYRYTDLDKAIIRILYDIDIPNGLSKKAFDKALIKFKNGKKIATNARILFVNSWLFKFYFELYLFMLFMLGSMRTYCGLFTF